jgi:putative tryptophan/tyrosine transport system substrate-binding protein
VIGFLASGLPEKWGGFVATVLQGLAEAGFVEGRNVTVEYRWAEDQYDRLPALARELVQHPLAVIVASGTMAAAVAAKAATSTVPIVFMIASDPVEHGLVASLSHPETNLTGVAYLNAEVSTKRLALLHEMVPAATSIAVLVNPANPIEADDQTRELRAAARVLGLNLLVLNARSRMEMEAAFAVLLSERSDALFVSVDPLFGSHRDLLIALAARHAVPTNYPWREFTVDGGLMNCGTNISDAMRMLGVYAGRILHGGNPRDLPVQRPTRLGLVLNLKTAKALNVAVPETLLATADEVIQ